MGNINIWCIIIPLITAIIGWLLGRFSSKSSEESSNINNDEADRIASLQADLDACRNSKSKLNRELDLCLASKKELASTQASISNNNSAATNLGFAATAASSLTSAAESEPSLAFDAAAAKLALGKKIIADDLKIIEGIGPKIAQLFNDNGVNTWYQLSKTSIERCQEILNTGGKRYEIHNPGTWPKQSGLAFEGKWKELNDLQDYLDGGVEPK